MTQRQQGALFVLLATAVTAATLALPRLPERTEMLALALVIVALGVPHGALDTAFARHLYRVRSVTGWCAFALAYVALTALVVGLWILSPTAFLLAFLAISLAHFSGDPAAGTPLASRLLYGGAILVLPALRHAPEVTRLFALLVGPEPATAVTTGLSWLSGPWLAALAISALLAARSDWLTALEFAAAAALAVLAPPLVAFTVFFCAMHGARHILRTVALSPAPASHVLREAILPMFATLALFGAALLWFPYLGFPDLAWESRVIRFLFVGLAALTVPHMLLVEQVRFAGWDGYRPHTQA